MTLPIYQMKKLDRPFFPITSEEAVLVHDKNGNEVPLSNILIKNTDISLNIKDGTLYHTANVDTKDTLGFVLLKIDKHGHINKYIEVNLSKDLYLSPANEICINYNEI